MKKKNKRTQVPAQLREDVYKELIKELSITQRDAGKIISISDFIEMLLENWRKKNK